MKENIKSIGVIRKVDELGRFVIPKEIQKKNGINSKDNLKIEMGEDFIKISKIEEKCKFCNSEKNLINYKDKFVCQNCINELKDN